MKKVITLVLSIFMFSNVALADCDFKTGITEKDGSYLYTKECHIKVGEMKRDLGIANEQVKKLNLSLNLKDEALRRANERADLWMDTSYKLEKRVETMDNLYQRNKWLYFGLGVLATSAAVYAAGQLGK